MACIPLAVAAPESQVFDRLTFHQDPKALPPDAVTEDWPRFLGPRHNLHSRESRLLKVFPKQGLSKVWEVQRGSGHAPTIISGRRLVMFHVLDGREVIECLDTETGQRYWKYEYPVRLGSSYGIDDAPRSGPVTDGELVFVAGIRGDLHCLELRSGRVRWKRNLEEDYGPAPFFFGRGGCPLVYGDQLIVNVGGKICVGGFDKKTGQLLWSSKHEWNASYASPVPAVLRGKERVLVFAGGMVDPPTGGLLSIDPVNGRIDDAFPWRARMFASVNAASPVVVGDAVFITESYTEGGALVGIMADRDFRLQWKAPRFGSQFTTPVFHEGHLYGVCGTAGTEIVCQEVRSGEEKWRDSIDLEGARLGRASLLRVDGAFLCLGAQGTLLWLDLSPRGVRVLARTQLFRAPETWGVPALSRGLLYVNQNAFGSRLVCYDVRGE